MTEHKTATDLGFEAIRHGIVRGRDIKARVEREVVGEESTAYMLALEYADATRRDPPSVRDGPRRARRKDSEGGGRAGPGTSSRENEPGKRP